MAGPPPVSILDATGKLVQTGVWASIIADSTIGIDTTGAASQDPTQVALTSRHFWNTAFSSKQNASRFPGLTSASLGDADQTVVLGMVPPTDTTTSLHFSEVLDTFNVDNRDTGMLSRVLLNALDETFQLTPDPSTSSRCAIWFIPGQDGYRSVVRMIFNFSNDANGPVAKLQSFLNSEFGLSLKLPDPSLVKLQATMKMTTFYLNDPANLDPNTAYEMTISFQLLGFQVLLVFDPEGMDFIITDPPDATPADSIFARLSSAVFDPNATHNPSSTVADPTNSDSYGDLLSHINLWHISLHRDISDDFDSSGNVKPEPIYGNTWWQINFIVNWAMGSGSDKQELLIGLQYDSRGSTFTGQLLLSHSFPDDNDRRGPDYDSTVDIPNPVKVQMQTDNITLQDSIQLWSIFSSTSPPSQLPTNLSDAMISYGNGGATGTSLLQFFCQVTGSSNDPTGQVPHGFQWTEAAVSVSLTTTATTKSVDVTLGAAFRLNPIQADVNKYPPANLAVGINYKTGGSWLLSGSVRNLRVGLLYDYFDSSIKDGAVAVLGNLNLAALDVVYTYDSGQASSFLMTGVIQIGELELDLSYQYVSRICSSSTAAETTWNAQPDKKPANVKTISKSDAQTNDAWAFEAFLGAKSAGSTIGSIANSIMGDDPGAASLPIPEFVARVPVAAAAGGSAPIKLILAKPPTSTDLIFVFAAQIDAFHLTFIQVSRKDGSGATLPPKRAMRVSVDTIPAVKSIPLINELPQPFQELLYLWVSSDGWTKDEVDLANAQLSLIQVEPITYKPSSGVGGSAAALAQGHHFIVLEGSNVILDHVFFNARSGTQPAPLPAQESPPPLSPTENVEPKATKGAITKTTPFINISAVSLQFKSGWLWVVIDATVQLGPISFSVIEFEIGIQMSLIKLNDLSAIFTTEGLFQFSIHGLAAGFEKPPLVLAGVFIHDTSDTSDAEIESYRGGIAVSVIPYLFLAVGEYQSVTTRATATQAEQTYKSIFIYAKLDGPLITLEFATIEGIRLGFGYNSAVRAPSVNEITQDPFINDSSASGAGNDPMKVINNMTQQGADGSAPWVTAKDGEYWFAMGLKISAADILSVTAVALFGFKSAGVIVSLYADGVAQMPAGAPPDFTLFYIEIGLVAEMNFIDGYFLMEASLAPVSHIYVPQCHIYGGVAFAYWFWPSAHTGDWVFSIGGYHPAFTPPVWYPVPKRLGISFVIGDNIGITGEAYFAVTPKCAMAGAMLHMFLSVGPVEASLDAAADFFIQYNPLHYTGDISVSVRISFNIDFLFVHIHIRVSIGASLHVSGPDFGGIAHVDFWLFGFDIHFGAQNDVPKPIFLDAFYEMVHSIGATNSDDSANAAVTDPQMGNLKMVLENGLFSKPVKKVDSTAAAPQPFPNTGQATPWSVRGGPFSFRINCDFAISDAAIAATLVSSKTKDGTITTNDADGNPNVNKSDSITPPIGLDNIFSKQMQLDTSTPITSTLIVTIVLDEDPNDCVTGWRASFVTKSVPSGVWGPYVALEDPMTHARPSSLTTGDGSTVNLGLGLSIMSPLPLLARALIPDFDAAAANRRKIGNGTGLNNDNFIYPIQEAPLQANFISVGVFEVDKMNAGTTDQQILANNVQRWTDFQNGWKSISEQGVSVLGDTSQNGGKGYLSLCEDFFGWNKRWQGQENDVWMLNGDTPEELIAELDTRYLALPSIGVGIVAS